MGIALAASLFTLAACVEAPALRPRQPTPGVPHVTVTTYNVDLKMAGDAATVEAVGATGADIVALQEVNEDWRRVLRDRYANEYPYMAFEGEGSGGLGLLSRYRFDDLGVLEGLNGWHPAWHVQVDAPVGPLQLLLVHLRPTVSRREGYVSSYFEADGAREREIEAFSASCSDEIPTLVLGDFNTSSGAAVRALEDLGFRSVLPLYRPGQETWRYDRSLAGQAIDTLDHIFFDDALSPLNAYVDYVGNSDHLPVTALFERPPQGSPNP